MAEPLNLLVENYEPYVMSNEGTRTEKPVYIDNDLTVTGDVIQPNGPSGEQIISAVSDGTTAVSVFGASGLPYAINITGVYLIARDTTATNITVEAPASTTVATIAKGATAGALVGASSLANNTGIAAGTNVIIDGSSTGVAQVFITYERA